MKFKWLNKVLTVALAACMTVSLMTQGVFASSAAADRNYLEVSISDGTAVIKDTSSQYLTAKSPLLVEIAQMVSNNRSKMAKQFASPAMAKLMDQGLQARQTQSKWDKYLAQNNKNLTDSNGVVEILKDIHCTLGDLTLGSKYTLSYRNDVKGDHGCGSVYTVTLTSHIVSNIQYTDVTEAHWAFDAIGFVSNRGLFNGVSANTFAPEALMTRQMLMTVLARLDGADTTGDPYAKGMAWATSKGISDGSNPTMNITRQQMVTMLYRYLGCPAVQGNLDSFKDGAQVAEYALNAMIWATTNGIIAGMGDSTLSPDGPATRAQVAMILSRFCTLTR